MPGLSERPTPRERLVQSVTQELRQSGTVLLDFGNLGKGRDDYLSRSVIAAGVSQLLPQTKVERLTAKARAFVQRGRDADYQRRPYYFTKQTYTAGGEAVAERTDYYPRARWKMPRDDYFLSQRLVLAVNMPQRTYQRIEVIHFQNRKGKEVDVVVFNGAKKAFIGNIPWDARLKQQIAERARSPLQRN